MTTLRQAAGPFVLTALIFVGARPAVAADQWIEVHSAHFTISSNAGKSKTATLAWQLEQVRSEIAVLWPWAKVDLNRPLIVFALKDEQSMKALAPKYWESKNDGVASAWASGYERTFLAVRTDLEIDGQRHINPYATSYFSYFSLILQQSIPKRLPAWFSRGLAGVMSNTVIEDAKILLGPPAPWYLQTLHDGGRSTLADLVKAGGDSPLLRGSNLRMFDAQSWALVHYLMFADNGAHWASLSRYAAMVASGPIPMWRSARRWAGPKISRPRSAPTWTAASTRSAPSRWMHR